MRLDMPLNLYVGLVERRETVQCTCLSPSFHHRLLSCFCNLPSQPSMMLNRLLSAFSILIATTSAQTISGLTFDSRDVVSMIWGFEGAVPTHYDFWLCAGDETTGSYVGHPTLCSYFRSRFDRERITPTGLIGTSHPRRAFHTWRLGVIPS